MKFLIEKTENEEYVIRFKWHGYYTGQEYVINNKPYYNRDIRLAKTFCSLSKAKCGIDWLIKEKYPKAKRKPKSEVVMEFVY